MSQGEGYQNLLVLTVVRKKCECPSEILALNYIVNELIDS